MRELQKWFDKINASLTSVNDQVMQALPTVLSFLLILALGFLISYILKKIVFKGHIQVIDSANEDGYISLAEGEKISA